MKRMVLSVFLAIGVLVCFSAGADNNIKIGGYMKSQFTYQPSDNGDKSETSVVNARIKVSGDIDDKTSFNLLFDTVKDEVLLDAYITRKIVSGVSVNVGQYKTPYSTDNLISNAKYGFVNRPYMRDDTSPAFRDRGVTLACDMSKFSAIVGMMNGSGLNKAETNSDKSVAVRLVAKAIPHLNLSGNYYTGKNNTANNDRTDFMNFGLDGTFNGWEYSAEFANKDDGTITGNSCFAWLSYDWTIDSKCVKTLTPALRAERSDPDTDLDDNAKSRYTLGLSAHFAKKYADCIIINYEIIELEKGDPDDMLGIQYNVSF